MRRVLVIDDDPLQLEIVRDHLVRRGVPKVVCVSHSETALSLLSTSDDRMPDLVISDIHMPGVDGIEIINFLSNLNDPPPIILVSGSGVAQLKSAAILTQAAGLNMLGALSKPLDMTELDQAIAKCPVLITKV